jgi:hypothetical protein
MKWGKVLQRRILGCIRRCSAARPVLRRELRSTLL